MADMVLFSLFRAGSKEKVLCSEIIASTCSISENWPFSFVSAQNSYGYIGPFYVGTKKTCVSVRSLQRYIYRGHGRGRGTLTAVMTEVASTRYIYRGHNGGRSREVHLARLWSRPGRGLVDTSKR